MPEPPGEIHFADNLRRLMGVHNAHGALVAEALGVSRQTVSDLIATKRRHPPSLDTLYQAAGLFEVEPDNLLRRPFWEWAPAYFAKMGESAPKPFEFRADGIREKLHDAGVELQAREQRKAAGR